MNNIDRKLIEMGLMEAEPGWFEVFLIHLKAYKEGHGHCKVHLQHFCPDGYKLGMQVSSIRSGHQRITDEQRAELSTLGFIWDASLYGAWWPEFIEHLKAFKTEYGHCRVPRKHHCPDSYKLAQRVNGLRTGRLRITEEQRSELDALGFIWNSTLYGVWWPEFLEHLRMFVSEQGHCRVHFAWISPDGYKLGNRVAGIRSGHNKLTEGQRSELDALGFHWTPRNWYPEFIQNLRAFHTEYGHCRVPDSKEYPKGYKLGHRVTDIRTIRFRITAKQRTELEALGFIWTPRDWYPEFLQYFKVFLTEQGHCKVALSWRCPGGYKLGMRVSGIRSGGLHLTPEQRAELDALGFIWDARSFRGCPSAGLKAGSSSVVRA